MLWSLIRIFIFVGLLAGLTWVGSFLLDAEGTGLLEGTIIIGGTAYPLSPIKLVIALVVLLVALWLLLRLAGLTVALLKFINGDETALRRYFDRNRERKGYKALSDGLLALASGEGKQAMAKAAIAERYLGRPDLTGLLTAQAAEMVGDKSKAEKVYKNLLNDKTTRFVGVRGLMKQKIADGDTDTALQLAERAFALKPKHEEVQDTLLQLQASSADWKGARKTLATKLKHGALPRDVFRRRDAVLALSNATDSNSDLDDGDARDMAIAANKNSPDLVPAAALAAKAYITQGKPRYAARVLKKTWDAQPHPDLAAAFAAIVPDETPAARLKRFKALTSIKPEHRETKLLAAELNLAAEDFPEARRALGDLPETQPDARVLAVMAAVEKGEGKPDAVVRAWLAKAVTASRGPQWVCDVCNTVHAEWSSVCTSCGAVDTLTWRVPDESEIVLPTGANMLPLLMDTPEETLPVAVDEAPEETVVNITPDDPAGPEAAEAADAVAEAEIVEEAAESKDSAKSA